MFINWVLVGTSVKDAILRIAQVITWDFVPGLISLALLSLLVVLVLKLWAVTRRRCRLLNAATRRIRRAGDRPGFQSELHEIEADIGRGGRRRPAQSIRVFCQVPRDTDRTGSPRRRACPQLHPTFRFFVLDDLHSSAATQDLEVCCSRTKKQLLYYSILGRQYLVGSRRIVSYSLLRGSVPE